MYLTARRTLLFISFVCGVCLPAWYWVIAPHLTQLPRDFSYRADMVSLDNFYDAAAGTFAGENRSVTKFIYDAVGQKGAALLIKNSFVVHQLTGDKIFAVERIYGIDPKTGAHLPGFGDRDRNGYLFAPRHLTRGEPFTYWHINYDGPAHMVFAGEENVFGLPVYRYESRYEGVRIDQTKNLGHVPGVGVTRGIELEPYLQLWIEPTSGYLVKYKDDTTAYFYDLRTGERLNPWNHFSNTYTLESTENQSEVAKQEKFLIVLLESMIPALFVLLVVVTILLQFKKTKMGKFLLIGVLTVIVLVPIGMWFTSTSIPPVSYSGPNEKIRIGVDTGVLSTPVWIADQNGYFEMEGIDVEIKPFSAGKLALQTLFEEGSLDVAAVGQTPFVLNSFDRSDYQVIAGMVSAFNHNKILARRDRGINSVPGLKGKKVAVTKGTSGQYLMGLFLAQNSLGIGDVIIVDIPASEISQALVSGKVDAIATWEPFIYDAQKALGNNALILEDKNTFRQDFYLTTLKETAKNNPKLLQRFLTAINKAETFIKEHPEESQRIMAERLKIDPLFVTSIWSDYDFNLFLDQAILLTFEQHARWAITNKFTDKIAPTNYIDYIYFDALEAVKSEAVTIIR